MLRHPNRAFLKGGAIIKKLKDCKNNKLKKLLVFIVVFFLLLINLFFGEIIAFAENIEELSPINNGQSKFIDLANDSSQEETRPNITEKPTVGEIYDHIPSNMTEGMVPNPPIVKAGYKMQFIISAIASTVLFALVVVLMVLIVRKKRGGTEGEDDLFDIDS